MTVKKDYLSDHRCEKVWIDKYKTFVTVTYHFMGMSHLYTNSAVIGMNEKQKQICLPNKN